MDRLLLSDNNHSEITAPFRECLGSCEVYFSVDESASRLLLTASFDVDRFRRGYADSLEQRFRLATEGAQALVDSPHWSFESFSQGNYELQVEYRDGETLPSYLCRLRETEEVGGFPLVLELLSWLMRLSHKPRIFSNVEPADFLVVSSSGGASIVLFPVGPILREEETKSDRAIAKEWLAYLADILNLILCRRRFDESARKIGETCAKALDEIEAGKANELQNWFKLVEEVAENEKGKWLERQGHKRLDKSMVPCGPLGSFWWDQFCRIENETFGELISLSSPYSGMFRRVDGEKRRVSLLIPEGWAATSVLEKINQKIAHPFLKGHHNGVRTLSVLCGENYTGLVAPDDEMLSLPEILAVMKGLNFPGVLSVLRKIHRTLEQFESAEFDLEIDSPYRICLFCEEAETGKASANQFLQGFSEWPAWDVKVRVEKPLEYFVENTGWRSVYRKLGERFFPAFVAWALDYSRFEWAARAGRIESEPASWDAELDCLLVSASKHLNENDASQRMKFMELLEEWEGT